MCIVIKMLHEVPRATTTVAFVSTENQWDEYVTHYWSGQKKHNELKLPYMIIVTKHCTRVAKLTYN